MLRGSGYAPLALRATWLERLRAQGLEAPPRALLLFAGRWSAEKRIHLLLEAVPPGCALVIVGDGPSTAYSREVETAGPASGRPQCPRQASRRRPRRS